MTTVRVDSRARIASKMETDSSLASTATEPFTASGTGSTSVGSWINAFIASTTLHRLSSAVGMDSYGLFCQRTA